MIPLFTAYPPYLWKDYEMVETEKQKQDGDHWLDVSIWWNDREWIKKHPTKQDDDDSTFKIC